MEHIGRSRAGYRLKFSRATGASWALYHELQGIWGRRGGGAEAQALVHEDWRRVICVSWAAGRAEARRGRGEGDNRLEQRGGARLDFGQRGC